jgi:pectin methylesterase-like acyl-CoA thioesterase
VKQGATPEESGKNLLSMIELANGLEGSERAVIFLPNGLYDLGETVLTTISRNNLSLVGQSMDGTIIKNAPDRSIEGIGTTATILNTSSNLYLQDLTLQNALDYYGAIDGGQVGGRAVCLQDKGKQTICKNVRMLSYQDTYYSNSNSQFYWETSEIHGTVDYLCGGGDVYYNKCTFVNESRAAGSKSGSDVVAAPYPDSSSKFGYVFSHCTIENKAASFSLGRSWGGLSKLTWLNTVINQPEEVIDTRFTLAGMNIAAYSFKEYNSTDAKGNVVSPASLVETFTHNNGNYTYDIILSDEEAEAYTLDKVFSNWAPAGQTVQVAAPTTALYSNGTVSWSRTQEATLYAVFKNGELVGITDYTYLNIDKVEEMKDVLTIRAANAMGGFGEEEQVSVLSTGIDSIGEDTNADVIYNMQGMRVNQADKGVYIINGKKIVVK